MKRAPGKILRSTIALALLKNEALVLKLFSVLYINYN